MSSQRPLTDVSLGSEPDFQHAANWREDMTRCDCGLAADVASGSVYNEEAFRYFLEIERKRSELSGRSFLLLLVDLKRSSSADADPQIDSPSADLLFSALTISLRETDFVGWYRAARTIGAVLTQNTDATAAALSDVVGQRVTTALRGALSTALATRVQVRVYQLPASTPRQS
jgi:hypothetical protein